MLQQVGKTHTVVAPSVEDDLKVNTMAALMSRTVGTRVHLGLGVRAWVPSDK